MLNKDQWFKAAESTSVVGRFVYAETVDVKASQEARKNVYKKVPVLQSKVPGQSQDISVQPVKAFNEKELRERFPGAWEHFEACNAEDGDKEDVEPTVRAIKGTPLHLADFIPREKIRFLNEIGFSEIEQIRDMSDSVAQGLGRGAMKWRKQAAEFLART
jgi:hypothetical protein